MKHLKTIYFVCSLILLGLFTSCEQDNIGTLYEKLEGVSFANTNLTSATVQPNNPTFTVDVFRGDVSGTLSGSVTMKAILPDKTELSGCTVSDYSFAAGETKTTVTVNVDPLPIGVELKVQLSIPKEAVSLDGISTTNVTVNKSYVWTSLGKGKYIDNWASGVEYEVEIQKAEGFDRYRAITPYVQTLKHDDGDWGDWIASSSAPYVEFWTVENNLVRFATFFIGVNYQADTKQPIYAYHASSFANLSPAFSKWLDAKRVQLAPYYYINNVGGWNKTQANGVIIITLP